MNSTTRQFELFCSSCRRWLGQARPLIMGLIVGLARPGHHCTRLRGSAVHTCNTRKHRSCMQTTGTGSHRASTPHTKGRLDAGPPRVIRRIQRVGWMLVHREPLHPIQRVGWMLVHRESHTAAIMQNTLLVLLYTVSI